MASFSAAEGMPNDYLLGVEIGRNKVRLALVDVITTMLVDVVERSVVSSSGPRDPLDQEFAIRAAFEDGLERLGGGNIAPVMVGATMGFDSCGVGSGPTIMQWLEGLSHDTGQSMACVGHPGVSYAPARYVQFVRDLFESSPLRLDRLELAPVAAARVLGPVDVASIYMGSGVCWSARVLNGDVLEAFEAPNGSVDGPLMVTATNREGPIGSLYGVKEDPAIYRHRGVDVANLGPSVGVAIGMVTSLGSNLLEAQIIGESRYGAGSTQARSGEVVVDNAISAPHSTITDEPQPVDPGMNWAPPENPSTVADSARHGVQAEPLDDGNRFEPTGQIDEWAAPNGGVGGFGEQSTTGSSDSGESAAIRRISEPGPTPHGDDDLAGIESFAHRGGDDDQGFHYKEYLFGVVTGAVAVAVPFVVYLVVG